jgi:hypothetical protein
VRRISTGELEERNEVGCSRGKIRDSLRFEQPCCYNGFARRMHNTVLGNLAGRAKEADSLNCGTVRRL